MVVVVHCTVKLPLNVALTPVTSPVEVTFPQPIVPTVMFGVPVSPCEFVAVSALPVTLPVTLPEKLVAVIIPETEKPSATPLGNLGPPDPALFTSWSSSYSGHRLSYAFIEVFIRRLLVGLFKFPLI